MSRKGASEKLDVGDALRKLRSLKHASSRRVSGETGSITEPDRDPTIGLVVSETSDPLSSDDPGVGGATAAGMGAEAVEEATTDTGQGESTPAPRFFQLSLGNWIGIAGLALTILVAWVGLATYFHGDLKTDLRELREDVWEGDEALQDAAQDLRDNLQSVQQQVEGLLEDTISP